MFHSYNILYSLAAYCKNRNNFMYISQRAYRYFKVYGYFYSIPVLMRYYRFTGIKFFDTRMPKIPSFQFYTDISPNVILSMHTYMLLQSERLRALAISIYFNLNRVQSGVSHPIKGASGITWWNSRILHIIVG